MATASDSATNIHSSRSFGFSNDGLESPRFRLRNLSPPPSNVRVEPEAIPAAPSSPSLSPAIVPPEQVSSSDCSPAKASSSPSPLSDNHAIEAQPESSDDHNRNMSQAKKPAWNKPLNGVDEVGPVMGAVSWPALSEATRPSPKSSPDSFKSDGSVSVSQEPVIASSPQIQSTYNANPNSTPKDVSLTRQKSIKRGGGVGVSVSGPANGGFSQPPLSRPPVVGMAQKNSGKQGRAIPDSSPRGHSHKSNNIETGSRGGFASQSHSGNNHPHHRNSFSRGSNGPHPRGDGYYHNINGSRRDQDNGNYEWNPHQNFYGGEFHMQQERYFPRYYIRPPLPFSTPYISPLPGQSFGNPMAFPDMVSPMYYDYVPSPPPEYLRGVPYITPALPPAAFFPPPNLQLRTLLVNQINFYFSNGNLISDTFLRENMDEQGWVPITLIAGFNKVRNMTNNIQLILDAVRTSTVVEVQGDKVRKRNEWMNWILPPSNQFSAISSPQSSGRSSYVMLTACMQNVSLEEMTSNQCTTRGHTDSHTEAILSRSSSGELNSQSEPSTDLGTGQVTVQAGDDQSVPTRN
ncbi:hypothetical protein HHK36_031176 [Tetracentron sinense]|uniref:HTH La-type RNA-binding domain-containing protein n=1 Tax=Tetracentron sinense TaxID=13715 RepID=A0A834YDH4_TETSI|nr:hypothetical protein HHK36_031176 [Tetracentron sinense]